MFYFPLPTFDTLDEARYFQAINTNITPSINPMFVPFVLIPSTI